LPADEISDVARLLDRARQQIALAESFALDNIKLWLSRLQRLPLVALD